MEEKIPQGFTKEVWEALSPEQRAVYNRGSQQNQGNQQSMQNSFMQDTKKQTIMMMVMSFLPMIFNFIMQFINSKSDKNR